MENLFKTFKLGGLTLKNHFVLAPIKTGYGSPDGVVTDRQLSFYRQIAKDGPAVLILEPVAVTPDGREHPKQLCVHRPESSKELRKIVDVIHGENRLACLHLNHAGAAANPKASGSNPKAPSVITCPSSGLTADELSSEEIASIIEGYRNAARTAIAANFDLIEIQGGHGYLISQFLNQKINHRTDVYGENKLRFARDVLNAVKEITVDLPIILRISGSEMSPKFGIDQEDLYLLLEFAADVGVSAIHVGMGSVCFSPPWYFHHASLPEKPQLDALAEVRRRSSLPIIIAGRMGRKEKVQEVIKKGQADLVALGRPLLADPGLLEKWQSEKEHEVVYCGYCLQGCLHRMKNGKTLGCNLNPTLGYTESDPITIPQKVLIAGGGPAGMSAALYLSKRGHDVTLVEKEAHLGGQFSLSWQAPGKKDMKDGLDGLEVQVRSHAKILTGTLVDAKLIKKQLPDLLVWATGVMQNIPKIEGLNDQHHLTSLEYFNKEKIVKGPRVLVIGAGRTGLEIVELLGNEGFEVVTTKRSDPIGSGMDLISSKLTLNRIGQMKNVSVMPHTTVKAFTKDGVEVEIESEVKRLEPFQTVILASGMLSAAGPIDSIKGLVSDIEVIGDAREVNDIYHAIQAGYELAGKY
jgi:2,4-dienoyl-CoA reductase-like NADH-dependent reductase (Old Yellow Enzyme family)/thioredoxin reductase